MVTCQRDGWNYKKFPEAKEWDKAGKMRGETLERQQF